MDVDVVKLLSSSVILFSSSPLIWVLEATSRLCHRTTVEGFRRPEDQIKGQIKPSSEDLSKEKRDPCSEPGGSPVHHPEDRRGTWVLQWTSRVQGFLDLRRRFLTHFNWS